jgi:hypothetical protein
MKPPAASLTEAQVVLTQQGSRQVQESANSAARRIEARSDDEVYYCYIYLYYCCYIYLYYCLADRRIEALSDDEVIRMLERVLAAMFERIRRLPLSI